MGAMSELHRQHQEREAYARDAALDLIDALKIAYVDLSDLADDPRVQTIMRNIRAALSKAEARV